MLDVLLSSLNGTPAGVLSGLTALPGGKTAAATVSGGAAGPARCADPLLCLQLWAAMLWAEGSLDAGLLRAAGLSAAKLEKLAAQHSAKLEELRWLRFSGQMFTRDAMTTLLRARLSELLMGATRASELLALTKALERMDGWMWGEEELSSVGGQLSASKNSAEDQASIRSTEGVLVRYQDAVNAGSSAEAVRRKSPAKLRQRRQ